MLLSLLSLDRHGTLAVIEFDGGFRQDAGDGALKYWLRRKDLLAQAAQSSDFS